MLAFQSPYGGVDLEMLPSHPPTTNGASAAKRKTPDDNDIFSKNTKKHKNDTLSSMNGNVKRKQPGEENFGGLVIVRGPPTRPPSSQDTVRPGHPSRTAAFETERIASTGAVTSKFSSSKTQKPPSSTTASDSLLGHANKRGKERDFVGDAGGEHEEVEEAVRQMNSEADNLRDRSRASRANMTPAAKKVDFRFPPPKASSTSHLLNSHVYQGGNGDVETPPPRTGERDTVMPITVRETPQIIKNKLLRGEHPSMQRNLTSTHSQPSRLPRSNLGLSSHSRRSSLSLRGKRSSASFETTGIITRPHTSVADSSLYKHIDPELPPAQRMRQLLIWTSSRASDPSANSSSSARRKSTSSKRPLDTKLPPLPPGGIELLKDVEEELIRQLAEKRIDTSGYLGPSEGNADSWKLKENEQNVRNKAREKLFTQQIEERRKEDIAWVEVAQFYEMHRDNVQSVLNQQQRTTMSAKARGKQRAASQEPENLEPWENELPDAFRGAKGYDAGKRLLHVGIEGASKGDSRREVLQYTEDRLHASVSVAHQLARIASADLDYRFSLLSIGLAQSTLPPASSSSIHNPSALSNFVPIMSLPSARNPGPDPQDLLRAISRMDASRPRNQVGDAARRAAKDVQRVNETQAQSREGGLAPAQRRLTDVPQTPRKPPSTPKRPGTPGTGKRG